MMLYTLWYHANGTWESMEDEVHLASEGFVLGFGQG